MLDWIKDRYDEEVGWSFTVFEGLTFILYLIALSIVLGSNVDGVWQHVLYKSLSDIVGTDSSALAEARILDVLTAAIATLLSVNIYKRLSGFAFDSLSRIKNLDAYVDSLKSKYNVDSMGGPAFRLHVASSAEDEKKVYLKAMNIANGVGLISIALIATSLFGMVSPNLTDSVILVLGLVGVVVVQWRVFATYTSQVVPRLVLERLARGQDIVFGEESRPK